MGEVLQANIFFFITAASVVVVTIFLAIILFYVIKIVRSVRRIVVRIEEGSEILAEDFQQARTVVSGTGSMLLHLLGFKAAMRNFSSDDAEEDEEEVVAPRSRRKRKAKTKLSIVDED